MKEPYNRRGEKMNNLMKLRLERGLTQMELSEASGVSRWAIQLFETGIRIPGEDQPISLAESLGTTLEALCPKFPIETTIIE